MLTLRKLALISLLSISSLAYADKTMTLPPFNAIRSDGVFDLEVNVKSPQSVVVKASDDAAAKVKMEVVDGELIITGPEKKRMTFTINSSEIKIAINVPSLRMFKGKGVGEISINGIDNDRMDIAYDGVGSLEAFGKTKWLRLKGSGIGEINTKKLLAEDADVDFDGIGEVQIFVSNHLNAVVDGIGSLTYFGSPKSVSKSADGIGSVNAGR